MWCTNCQQDVPAIAQGDTARCASCGRFLVRNKAANFPNDVHGTVDDAEFGPAIAGSIAAAADADLPDDGDWLLDDEMERLRSEFNLPHSSLSLSMSPEAFSSGADSGTAAATSYGERSNLSQPAESIVRSTSTHRVSRPNSSAGILAWTILSLGLMAFSCGGLLLAWSFIGHRNDLWNVGLPIALAGQFGLLLGLVMQLDHLWHANRRTADTLAQVDERLAEINHATALLQTSGHSPAKSFYVHQAENAHPHLQLSDLKGQLDQLANKLAQQR